MAETVYSVLRKGKFELPLQKINRKFAKNLATQIHDEWFNNLELYQKAIKEVLGDDTVMHVLPTSKLSKSTEPTVREEGNTAYTVDNPVIKAIHKTYAFYIRITVAICFQGSSTKNWTRVSLDDGISNSPKVIKEIKQIDEKIATKCCETSHKIITDTFSKNDFNLHEPVGDFVIRTFGIQNSKLGNYLSEFNDVDLELKQLFAEKKEAKRLIGSYYEDLFDNKLTSPLKNTDKNYWLRAASSVVDRDGFVSNNNVLYNINVKKDILYAWGIGYDNTNDGALARTSSLNLAKTYALKI